MKSHSQSRLSHRRKARPLTVAHAVGSVHLTPTTSHESHRQPRTAAAVRSSLITRHCLNQSLAKQNRKAPQSTENKHHRPQSIASFCRDFRESRSPAPAITTHHVHIITDSAPTTRFLIYTTAIRNDRNSQKTNNGAQSDRQYFEPSARAQYCFGPSAFAAIIVP